MANYKLKVVYSDTVKPTTKLDNASKGEILEEVQDLVSKMEDEDSPVKGFFISKD